MRSGTVLRTGVCNPLLLRQGSRRIRWSHCLSLFGVQPHRSKSFKLSIDPYFVQKLRDIVALYLSPPTNDLVLCVDEKSPFSCA